MEPTQAELLADYVAHMSSVTGRQLLESLVARGRALQAYSFELRMKGYLRTARYWQGKVFPFAFIVNRADVLFYVRKEGRRHPKAALDVLSQHFPDAKVNSRGEIQFHVDSERNAEILMNLLFAED